MNELDFTIAKARLIETMRGYLDALDEEVLTGGHVEWDDTTAVQMANAALAVLQGVAEIEMYWRRLREGDRHEMDSA